MIIIYYYNFLLFTPDLLVLFRFDVLLYHRNIIEDEKFRDYTLIFINLV